jgi:hypothetical protein
VELLRDAPDTDFAGYPTVRKFAYYKSRILVSGEAGYRMSGQITGSKYKCLISGKSNPVSGRMPD